jgi:glycosidase
MASRWPALLTAFSLAWLTACGGGGGAAAADPTPAPAPSPAPAAPPAVDTTPVAQADPGSPLPATWSHGAFMQIYVRGYQDSDGDGIGDLRGLIQRLDYLKDLGVTGLWLMPITASQDHDHGYAVTDYRSIEAAYGNLADLDDLVAQAHQRGIGVILDYVLNHSAGQHPLFLNSSFAKDNLYRNWYVWLDTPPTGWSIYGANPWRTSATGSYFAPFWDQMPDFNLRNPLVQAWHQDNLRFWLNRGVDGFRFDAVGNLVENGPSAWENQPENTTLMHDVNSLLSRYSRRYMVCEAPTDPKGFGASTACGGAFAFDLSGAIVRAAKGDATALGTVTSYFSTAPAGMATMVSNHDSFAGQRLWNQVGGNLAQYKLAAATYLLLPGTPFIYYGEEIGLAGAAGLQGDAALRTPMSWTPDATRAGFTTGQPFRALSSNVATQNVQAQQADATSLLAHYKRLLALRNTRPSLFIGSYASPLVAGQVMGWQRSQGAEKTLVLINVGSTASTIDVPSLPANARLLDLYPSGNASAQADASGVARLTLPAQSLRVIDVQP